ncbi:MAG: hypothetical protein ABSF03_19105 [Streptosporangiaceae bacterium]|jgi:hypothetical protein
MRIVIAMVIGVVIAAASAAVLVHNVTAIPHTTAGQLYNYGST